MAVLDLSALIKAIPALLYGAFVTLRITVLSIAMGWVIGFVTGLARFGLLYSVRFRVPISSLYEEPLLVQIFIVILVYLLWVSI